MPETHRTSLLEIDAVVNHVRSLWRDASTRAQTCGIELYAKLSRRTRIERDGPGAQSSVRHALETGMAIRTLTSLEDGAGFASASGLSSETASWVLQRAIQRGACVSAESPDLAGVTPRTSTDLDADEGLPDLPDLVEVLECTPAVSWLEAGTTIEVLVGMAGWHTVRRRHRVWGKLDREAAPLVAHRRLLGWRQQLERGSAARGLEKAEYGGTARSVAFSPEAASPIVSALVSAFHTGEVPSKVKAGPGWTIDDDPLRPDGLAGGDFDDAGFPAERRSLAASGTILGGIHGPGSLWRRSFRDPPIAGPSNLTMPSTTPTVDPLATVTAEASRVIRIRSDLWVLELRFPAAPGETGVFGRQGYVRLSPVELLARCEASVGPQGVTPDGLIVPTLRFADLPLVIG